MAKMTDLLKYLNRNGVQYTVLRHDPAFRAHDVALVMHVPESQLAKTLIVRADNQHWMVVLRADQRLDEHLLKRALGAKHVHLVHEEDLVPLFPDCQLGAMPPFGNLYGLPILVEKLLEEDREIIFNACTHTEAVKMSFEDYDRLVQPIVARVAESSTYVKEYEER
jgi:Ala-tRNA(Pro) deacylase